MYIYIFFSIVAFMGTADTHPLVMKSSTGAEGPVFLLWLQECAEK